MMLNTTKSPPPLFKYNLSSNVILPFAFIIVLILILSAPLIYGYKNVTPNHRFMGITARYPTGQFYYLSVGPSQALKGEFLFSDKYERIPRSQVIINPIANLIGLIAIIFNVSLSIAFFIYRILATIALISAFLYLVRQFYSNQFIQFIALLFYCFAAGFDYYFNLFKINPVDCIDDSIPEANMFISMCGEYYLPLANALFIMALATAYNVLFKSRKQLLACGLFLLLLGSVYIYGLISAVFIISITAIYTGIKERRVIPILISLFKLSLFCLPVAIYYLWLMMRFPAIGDSGWYNFPSFFAILCSFGFGFLFSFMGLFVKDKKTIFHEFFLILWIAGTLALIYLPQSILSIQIQLLIGLGAPLAILFASTIDAIIVHWREVKGGLPISLTICTLIFICSMTNIKFYTNQLNDIQNGKFPYYLNSKVYDAMKWSSNNISDKKLVIVSRRLGFIFSSITACNVYCGIGTDKETPKEQKTIEQVFKDLESNKINEAKLILNKTNANYLFLDQSICKGNYEQITSLVKHNFKICFSNDSVTIAQVD